MKMESLLLTDVLDFRDPQRPPVETHRGMWRFWSCSGPPVFSPGSVHKLNVTAEMFYMLDPWKDPEQELLGELHHSKDPEVLLLFFWSDWTGRVMVPRFMSQ